MKLGIVTPIVSINPRFKTPQWELDGGAEALVAVARTADTLGYDFVGCPEHVAIPTKAAEVRGGRYYDPVATLSYLAAHTERIGLLSHVTVLGYHHPLEIVKRYGTLDELSGGRVILGVGVGSLKPEFRLVGAEFDGRGAIADDALRAIRASFGNPEPAYAGTHYEFSNWIVEPCGMQSAVRIWVGGNTRRSLRRGLELADGWIPFGLDLDALRAVLAEPSVARALAERATSFDLVFAPEPPVDPSGDPEATRRIVEAYRSIGATGLSLRFRHSSQAHYLEQLEAMGPLVEDHN